MDTQNTPYSFIKKINESFYQKEEMPLIAGFYPLSLDGLKKHLEKSLKIQNLSLSITKQRLLESHEVLEGFSSSPKQISILLSPLADPVLLLIDEKDAQKILNIAQPEIEFDSPILQSTFFTFTLLNTLNYLEEVGFLEGLSPKIIKDTPIPEGYCLDILLEIQSISIPIRLCLPDLFRKQWNGYFADIAPYQMPEKLQENVEILLSFTLGSTVLSEQQIINVKKGDFIALEKSSFDPKTSKGSFHVMLNNNCLFRAKTTETSVKLLEYVSLDEDIPMPQEENTPEELIKMTPEKPQPIAKVPLTVTVEVAKISMPLSQLKKLQPGNTLPLSISPEEGVALTVNNKVIGRGELVYLGEKLGVRILDWGKEKKAE